MPISAELVQGSEARNVIKFEEICENLWMQNALISKSMLDLLHKVQQGIYSYKVAVQNLMY